MFAAPLIHQGVAGPDIETERCGLGEQRYIGDTTDVNNTELSDILITSRLLDHGSMKQWREWCTLPAGRDVSSPEICHHGNACHFSNDIWITDLQRERSLCVGLVQQCLTMTANRRNSLDINTGLVDELMHGAGKAFSDFDIGGC